MIGVQEFAQVKGKPRRGGSGKERKGSRRFVVLGGSWSWRTGL